MATVQKLGHQLNQQYGELCSHSSLRNKNLHRYSSSGGLKNVRKKHILSRRKLEEKVVVQPENVISVVLILCGKGTVTQPSSWEKLFHESDKKIG